MGALDCIGNIFVSLTPYVILSTASSLGHLPTFIRWVVEKIMAKPIFYIWKEDPEHVIVNVTMTPVDKIGQIPTTLNTTPIAPTTSTADASQNAASTKPESAPATAPADNAATAPETDDVKPATEKVSADGVVTFSFTGHCMHEAHFMQPQSQKNK